MSKNIKLIINYGLGPLLFIILSFVIYKQLIGQPDLRLRWYQMKSSWYHPFFGLAFIFMFLNWGIEAIKLRYLLKHLESISFLKSMKSVFAGCSVTLLTPNRTGEFGGRILYLKPQNRANAISLNIIGSISQLAITMLLGCFSMNYFLFYSDDTLLKNYWFISNSVFYTGLIATFLLIIFYFKVHYFVLFVYKFPVLSKLTKYIKIVQTYKTKELLTVFVYSLFRYLVFILQYIFVLKAMHVDIDFKISCMLLMLFYFIMTLAPTIGFTELPVRATLSMLILGAYSTNILGIQIASFVIWFINLVLPALIGSILISSLKLINENE